jgi:hypothetical protein
MYHLQQDMIEWCKENFGLGGGWVEDEVSHWSVSSAFGNTFFKFKREADATLFALRWVNGRDN